ncbi:MAG: response regulator [Lachnospiraceae bacterium]|nr:response regulator [Lachnospiraceae bacterium]
MQIVCVDHSPWELRELESIVKSIMPSAITSGFRNSLEAEMFVRQNGCDVLLCDLDFDGPKWEGLDLAEKIKKLNPKVNIIFVTNWPEREYAESVVQLRISGYVRKPYDKSDLEEEFLNLRYKME